MAKNTCEVCSHSNGTDSCFCSACGAELPAAKLTVAQEITAEELPRSKFPMGIFIGEFVILAITVFYATAAFR